MNNAQLMRSSQLGMGCSISKDEAVAALVKHPASMPPLESMQEHLFCRGFGIQQPQPRASPRGHTAQTGLPGLRLFSGEKRWKKTQIVTLIRALLCYTGYISLSTHDYSLHDYSCKTAYSLPETKLRPST